MTKGFIPSILYLILLIAIIASCSTTRVVPDGSYRLKDNKIIITNSKKYPQYHSSDINSYIRQKPNTYYIGKWNPFIYVYNWSSGKNTGWDKFVEKIGQAPIVFDEEYVDKSLDNIENHLEYMGFYNNSVQDSIKTKKKNVTVDYKITLGKQFPITRINYSINDQALKQMYFADTLNSLLKVGVPLSENILNNESERASQIFRDNGYYGFSKNYFFFEADTMTIKDSAILMVMIKNYTRNEDPSQAKPHKIYNINNVTIYPVSNTLRYRASLIADKPQKLDTFQYRNLYILYDGKLKIRPKVLENMTRVIPGETYSENKVNSTYQRFSNMRLFNSINMEMTDVGNSQVDCNIKLIPAKSQGYKINLEASVNSTGLFGISPAISYYHRNIFRGGEWFNLSFMGNFQFKAKDPAKSNEFGVSASLSLPTFLFLPDRIFKKTIPRTDFRIAYNYQKRIEYTRNMISGEFGYSWNSKSKRYFYNISPIQINVVKMFNMSDGFYEALKDPFLQASYKDHFDLGSGAMFTYSTDPALVPKVSNFKASVKGDVAGNVIALFNGVMPTDKDGNRTIWGSPYSQYARAEVSLVKTWVMGRKGNHSIALRGLAGVGYSYGNSTAMPFERTFWAGGANSLRGWQARTIGPGTAKIDTTFAIPNQTGDVRLEANLEYRFPIVWLLKGAVFFDAGNVWNIRQAKNISEQKGDGQFRFNDFYKSIALNTGIGLRVDIQFVIIRLDMGLKLFEPSTGLWRGPNKWFNRDGYSFQFGIGYPF